MPAMWKQSVKPSRGPRCAVSRSNGSSRQTWALHLARERIIKARIGLVNGICGLLYEYGWFTEAFDTADLQEAKALLDEWS
jgi:hypothetical protein